MYKHMKCLLLQLMSKKEETEYDGKDVNFMFHLLRKCFFENASVPGICSWQVGDPGELNLKAEETDIRDQRQ